MKSYLNILLLVTVCAISTLNGQQSFTDKKGFNHWWGKVSLDQISTGDYDNWYHKYSTQAKGISFDDDISNKLKDLKVKIFLGTWCGDTQFLVPQFIEIWKQSGLDINQIELIALGRNDKDYKRAPNNEEKEYNIHRVPTLVFHQDDKEIGRITERPLNSLVKDISQIAVGFPSTPRYRAVDYVYDLLETTLLDSLMNQIPSAKRNIRREITTSSELNTLGYVLMAQDELIKARFVFALNKAMFPYEPNTYDSLGECLFEAGDLEGAKEHYQEVLRIDSTDDHAISMISKINQMTNKS